MRRRSPPNRSNDPSDWIKIADLSRRRAGCRAGRDRGVQARYRYRRRCVGMPHRRHQRVGPARHDDVRAVVHPCAVHPGAQCGGRRRRGQLLVAHHLGISAATTRSRAGSAHDAGRIAPRGARRLSANRSYGSARTASSRRASPAEGAYCQRHGACPTSARCFPVGARYAPPATSQRQAGQAQGDDHAVGIRRHACS